MKVALFEFYGGIGTALKKKKKKTQSNLFISQERR